MDKSITRVGSGFWNIRGSFRVAGLLDVGTQASLLRLESGEFALLDCYSFSPAVQKDIKRITGGIEHLTVIINLHPFHTLHVEAAHALYPDARLYGTKRHLQRFPRLPWQPECSESGALHRMFSGDLKFSVPRGVDFISDDEHVHFSSVLAYHPRSKTIHSDDTFNHVPLAGLLTPFGLGSPISFHPTLGRALQKRPGAAQEFHTWAHELIVEWRDAQNLCAAHSSAWLGKDHPESDLDDLLMGALARTEGTLNRHMRKFD